MIVLGIDPSLTGTGTARIDTLDPGGIRVATWPSKAKGDSVTQRLARLERLVEEALSRGDDLAPDLVVIEAPAYDSRTGKQHDRSGLWWFIVQACHDRRWPVVEVTTGGVKKYATGKGNASKDGVLLAVARRFPHVEVTNNNEADALILAAMGADHLGHPVVDLPQTHRASLAAVTWTGAPA